MYKSFLSFNKNVLLMMIKMNNDTMKIVNMKFSQIWIIKNKEILTMFTSNKYIKV